MNLDTWTQGGQSARVHDLRVFYRRDGHGPPLLCLHGFPTSSWDFAPIWPALTARFDTLAPDLIGLGASAKPRRALDIGLQADVVEGLLASLGVRCAHLLAHDLGDTVAQELLARQLEGRSGVRWLSCALLNGGLFPEAHRPRLIQRLLASPLGPWIAALSSERTFRRNLRQIFSPLHPPGEAFLRESWRLLVADDGRAMLPLLLRYLEERRRRRDRWVGALCETSVPLRLIDGVRDPIAGEAIAARFEALVPRADVVRLADAGHYPHVELPEQVVSALAAFWDAVGTGEPTSGDDSRGAGVGGDADLHPPEPGR